MIDAIANLELEIALSGNIDLIEDPLAAEDAAAEREQKQAEELDSIEDPLAAEDAAAERERIQEASTKKFKDYVASYMGATDEQIERAYKTLEKEYDVIDHDSIDRERMEDILVRDEGLEYPIDDDAKSNLDDVLPSLTPLDAEDEEAEALAEEDYLADLTPAELEEVLGPRSRGNKG